MRNSENFRPKKHVWRSTGIKGDVGAALNAVRGLKYMFRTQRPFKLQILAAALYAVAGLYRGISPIEWMLTGALVTLVLFAETVNTAFEQICDFIHAEHHEDIGVIKDIAAGAVLICVLASFFFGSIFLIWPHIGR